MDFDKGEGSSWGISDKLRGRRKILPQNTEFQANRKPENVIRFLTKAKTARYCCAVMARKLMNDNSLMVEMCQFVSICI